MKYLFLLLLFFTTSIGFSQTIKVQYRYYYNSEVDFIEKALDHVTQNTYDKLTTVDYSYSSYFGGETHLPFDCFDLESPLYSHKFSLDASAYYLYDHNHNRFNQQHYNFGLNFKLLAEEPVYISTKLSILEIIGIPKATVWTGHDYKVGINYNTINQTTPNIVNFYGEVNYFVYGDYITSLPYGNNFIHTHDIETILGLIINIKDVLFFNQGVTTYTRSNLPEEFTFSPYHSYYTTKVMLKYKKTELDYTHICFHRIESDNENPRISGVLNSFGLTYNF